MNSFLALSASILVITSQLCAQEAPLPPAADAVLKSYELEVAASREKALRQLEAILATETQRANHNTARAVRTAIASLSTSTKSAVAAVVAPKTGNLSVKGADKFGTEIGTFTAGMTLKLQYVEGRWEMSGGAGSDPTTWKSPDDPGIFASVRLGVFALVDGQAKLLTEVPSGTKKKPFRYRFDKNYPMVILRILDTDAGDNPGFVIYNVEVPR